jgi:HD-GYP domain-containing protein (c-di-GMP phosphodiesterase class II)
MSRDQALEIMRVEAGEHLAADVIGALVETMEDRALISPS